MLCEQLMRRPVRTCTVQENIEAVARAMRDANVGFLPVCDEHNAVVGVVTDRDLAVRVLAEHLDPKTTRIGDVMTHGMVRCHPKDEVARAERLMAEHRKSRILVMDASDTLLGVISLADIAVNNEVEASETLGRVATREVLDARGNLPD